MAPLTQLDQLAQAVATDGIDAVPAHQIDAFAAWAVASGASPVIASVLTDPAAPAVVRLRAFGRLAMVAGRVARPSFAIAA